MSAAPRFVAMFPGQGSHAVGMGRALYDASPAARATLDAADAVLPGLLERMFDGPLEALTATETQQPALLAAGAAAWAAWREAGGPDAAAFAGHSLGEWTAHVAAGTLPLEAGVRLVARRGRFMQEAVPAGEGRMAAILKLDDDAVDAICDAVRAAGEGVVEVANRNAPGQVVVSGDAGAVDAAARSAKASGGRAVPLQVSAPFHCSRMAPAADRLASELADVSFAAPRAPLWCNVDAAPLPDASAAADRLTRQVTAPVRWTEEVRALADAGPPTFVEFGGGRVLSTLVGRTLEGAATHVVHDPETLAATLAALGDTPEGGTRDGGAQEGGARGAPGEDRS